MSDMETRIAELSERLKLTEGRVDDLERLFERQLGSIDSKLDHLKELVLRNEVMHEGETPGLGLQTAARVQANANQLENINTRVKALELAFSELRGARKMFVGIWAMVGGFISAGLLWLFKFITQGGGP